MINKKLRRNPVVRAVGIPIYRTLARGIFFYPPPRVLVNGSPKAGIHLLESLLKRLPRMMHSGVHLRVTTFAEKSIAEAHPAALMGDSSAFRAWDVQQFRHRLSSIRNGQFVTCHLPAVPSLVEVVESLNFRHVMIIRDPRDMVVSNAFYVGTRPEHEHHHRFSDEWRTPEQRIMALIEGFSGDDRSPGKPDIGVRLASYMPLVDADGSYTCRFESLIGPSGGGTLEAQRHEIESIADYVDRSLDPAQLARVTESVWSPRSATFRKGAIGDWKDHFTEEHREAFKRHAGQHLIRLGYERDLDW